MNPKFNQLEKICFDDLCDDPKSAEVFESAVIQEHIEQELNKLPVDQRQKILIEFYHRASLSAHEKTQVLKDTMGKITPPKIPIFGWSASKTIATELIEEIDDKLYIFVDRSSSNVLVKMVTCDDLSQCKEKVYVACMTNLFGYFVGKFKPLCKSFNPATIERCGLFVSKNGNMIKANNLYNTTPVNLQEKKIMDSIFKKILFQMLNNTEIT